MKTTAPDALSPASSLPAWLAGLAALALLALHFDWGIAGVWCGLLALMAVRLLTLGARFRGRRWAVVGAPAARA